MINIVIFFCDMRQDFVDKVMSVDCVLYVFDMFELVINIIKGEKIVNFEFIKMCIVCIVMYCFVYFLLLYIM